MSIVHYKNRIVDLTTRLTFVNVNLTNIASEQQILVKMATNLLFSHIVMLVQ